MRPRSKHLSLPLVVTALTAVAVGQKARFFRTGDGSPFLLVPVESHSINWVNLQPSGPREEPAGMQGLGLAIARASLFGGPLPKPTQGNPLGWEKALRSTPASGSRIVQIADHVGIAVTFAEHGLERIARLLRVRTTRENLLGVTHHLNMVRKTRSQRLRTMPHLGIMRRTLAAFESAKPLLTSLAEHSTAEVSPAAAQAYFRRTCTPARSLNVITGNLRLDDVERQLKLIFATPPPVPPGSTPGPTAPTPQIKAPRDAADTLMLGCPIPANLDAEAMATLDLLVEYLAGDAHAYLPDHLRASGHPRVRVQARAPFPAAGGVFLISVTKPGATLTEDDVLTVHLEQALAKVATDEPDADRLARAVATLQAARSATLQQPEGLATLLARRWARTGTPPVTGLAEATRVSGVEFRALARRVFALSGQTLCLPEVGK